MASRRRNVFVLLFIIGLALVSLLVILTKPTKKGLDLAGGTSLVYQGRPTPQNPEVTSEDMDRSVEIIRERTDKLGVSEPEISRIGSDAVQVDLPDVSNADRAISEVGTTAQLYLYDWEPNVIRQNKSKAPEQSSFAREFDAVKFASKQKPECHGCTTTGAQYYLFDKNSEKALAGPEEKRSDLFVSLPNEKQPKNSQVIQVPQGTVVLKEPGSAQDTSGQSSLPTRWWVLRDRPSLTGTDITNPKEQQDPQTSQPSVTFDFTGAGRTKFQNVTRKISQRGLASAPPGISSAQADQYSGHFAVVLDGEVKSRPIINFVDNPDGIDGRTGAQISGSFTIQSAQDLANFLEIGALPVKLKLISQSTVSATLGQQALNQGVKAGIVGLALVILFLLAYYRFLGLIAALGLGVYALLFFALIKLIPITLTLPGIAGLILTIGVAADANIVIFERIKEEARGGRSIPSAIAAGYKKGIATIVDANVITLITAFILFVLATAGVKGFAFVLGVGTIVSLLTAVVFTQAVLGSLGRTAFLRSPGMIGARGEGLRWHFDFMGASRYFFSLSGVILAIGAISFATKQLNLGIDFESGTRVEASLNQAASTDAVRTALTDASIQGASNAEVQEVTDQNFGPNVVLIRAKIPPNQVGDVQRALTNKFGLHGGTNGFQSSTVGPTFGAQVAKNALYAIIFSLLVIMGYVAIRFQPKYAVPVLIALFHDILITGGVYSLTGQEVTSGTVAAFLTILGYSMYDTVIVFDRIRENVPRLPRAAFSQIVNRSMSEVLTRSLITGASTVFLIGVLLAFGGATLRDFAFAMMVGVASGTYSSIFIASPVLSAWKERESTYRAKRERIVEAMGHVPAFPEENLVAKVGEEEAQHREKLERERARRAAPADGPREAPAAPVAPAAPAAPVAGDGDGIGDGVGGDGVGDGNGAADAAPVEPDEAGPVVGAGSGSPGPQDPPQPRRDKPSRRRQQRRRRKHGRHR
jgi:SecD/SecF fusion protein